MIIAGYISALFIGILLGLIGSGGSILAVPVLVYLMKINPVMATTCSLFIVGMTSLTGGINAFIKKQVDFETVTEFGIPSIFSVFITRHYFLPAIPAHLFYIGHLEVTKDNLLMLLFGLLMFIAGFFILNDTNNNEGNVKEARRDRVLHLVCAGILTGIVTGLSGAGGGFLIIPILVVFLRLPMKSAVGTSLMIVAINSLFGFLFSLKQFSFDWQLLGLFTIIAMIGIFIGSRFSDKVPANLLKKIFGVFVLVMATYIIIREILFPGQ